MLRMYSYVRLWIVPLLFVFLWGCNPTPPTEPTSDASEKIADKHIDREVPREPPTDKSDEKPTDRREPPPTDKAEPPPVDKTEPPPVDKTEPPVDASEPVKPDEPTTPDEPVQPDEPSQPDEPVVEVKPEPRPEKLPDRISKGVCWPGQVTRYTCNSGDKVDWCTCKGASDICFPVCANAGKANEGWIDGCSQKSILQTKCSTCTVAPTCDKVGTADEGWYCDGKLIKKGTCHYKDGNYTCISQPDQQCPQCKTAADCPAKTCLTVGLDCEEYAYSCVNRRCVSNKTSMKQRVCDAKSGTCKRPDGYCTKRDDCKPDGCLTSGNDCVDVTWSCLQNRCKQGSIAVSNALCDTKTKKCVSRVQCKVNGDCGKTTCANQGADCEQTTPTCTNGKCSSAKATLKNATCDQNTGTCKASNVCAQNSDCGKTTCAMSGNDCVQSTPTCTNGKCSVQKQTQSGLKCDTTSGICQVPTCATPKDCGKPSCQNITSGSVTNCEQREFGCTNKQCVPSVTTVKNSTCNLTTGICNKPAPTCQNNNDCGKPTCVDVVSGTNKNCEQINPVCSGNKCSTSTNLVKNATCDKTNGICKPTTASCTKDSDCGKSKCFTAVLPKEYSCDLTTPKCSSQACIPQQSLQNNAYCDENTGSCKSTPACTADKDCANIKPGCSTFQQGGKEKCEQVQPSCDNKKCIPKTTVVDDATCVKATGLCKKKTVTCSANGDCGKNKCITFQQGGQDYCEQTTPTCDNKVCKTVSKTIANATCDQTSGTCKATPKCAQNGDCGKPSCLTFGGTNCEQTTPTCTSGVCSKKNSVVNNATCDKTTGLCKALPKCTSDASCGKASCIEFKVGTATNCEQTEPACDKATGKCSTTLKVVNNATCDKTTGLCKSGGPACTQPSSCGPPTCANVNASGFFNCEQKEPTCVSGKCGTSTKVVQNSQCDQASGLCKARVCAKPADCGKTSCIDFKVGAITNCEEVSPTCSGGKCGTSSKVINNATCDKTSGTCKSIACKVDADCGKVSCLGFKANGQDNCEQNTPSCSGGVCSIKNALFNNATCDKTSGTCKAKSACTNNASCGKPTCASFQAGGINKCEQNLPTCTSGKCAVKTSISDNATCNKTTGLCAAAPKCTKAGDCGKASCTDIQQSGQTSCEQTTPICNNGSCSSTNQVVADASCDKTTGICKKKACTKASDCGKPACLEFPQSGITSCEQTSPTCSGGVCGSTSKVFNKASCDKTTGLCQQQNCASDADCGKKSCFDDAASGSCIQQQLKCVNNVCVDGTGPQAGKKCDQTSGLCK